MGAISIHAVTKSYGGLIRAVDNIDLEVGNGEFVVLVGPSGCGKTTLLRMIAGLEDITEGVISIGGRDVTDLDPGERDIAMVFQNYALYPHMTVRQNLGYGLRVRGTDRDTIARQVNEVARMLGLQEYLDRRPPELSGGQRQRVALGRAIARRPAAYLMDEPLSNLDAKLRVVMRSELTRLHAMLGVTVVYVTHDQVEAMTLGDRVAVMRRGKLEQFAAPKILYDRPRNIFVAAFIGSPPMNLVSATITNNRLLFGGFDIDLAGASRQLPDGPVTLGIRSEAFEDAQFSDPKSPTIAVTVAVVEQLGPEANLIFPIDAPRLDIDAVAETLDGETATQLAAEDRAIFNARVDSRTAAAAGDAIRLTIDTSKLYFFDASTGDNLDPAVH